MKNENKKLRSSSRERITPIMAIMLSILIFYTICLCSLLFWATITSFKHYFELTTNIIGLPKKWVWNYSTIWEQMFVEINKKGVGSVEVHVPEMAVYSILYSVGCTITNTMVPCLTAYMCARFPYKCSKIVHTTVIIVMIIPIVGSTPADLMVAKAFGLYDSIWGMWIMSGNFLGMYFLVFYGTFKTLPMAYSEAAKMDGAGNFAILFKIILPMMKNTIFTIMLIKFIGYWNDYGVTLLWLPSYPNLARGVYELARTIRVKELQRTPMRMAGAVLMMIPTLLLFVTFHKRLIGNLRMGGLKG